MKTKIALCLLAFALPCGRLSAGPFEPSMQRVAPPLKNSAGPLNGGPANFPYEFRSIDGTGNNPIDSTRGAANTPLLRTTTNGYADGSGAPGGVGQRSAREISNLVVAQDALIPNSRNVSDFIWQWGQFIDHDMDLTPSIDPVEPFNVAVPAGDPFFDPNNTGTQVIELDRSLYEMINGVREQVNVDTAYIDASQVYGSDEARAHELRRLDGSGKLKTSAGNLLPYNIHGFPNVPTTEAIYFLAGDLRSNEQLGLTAMHTLFMREHNFWADVFRVAQPYLNDDGIYFRARAIVGCRDSNHHLPRFSAVADGQQSARAVSRVSAAVECGHRQCLLRPRRIASVTRLLSPQLRRLDIAQSLDWGYQPGRCLF